MSSVPLGVQPQAGGRLICRYCGKPYAKLSQHLRMAYGISPDDYRAEFELPATMPLMAEHLREAIGARSRERLRTDPAAREALQLDEAVSPEREQRAARGRRRARETASRAGVQRSWQVLGEQAGQRSRDRAQQIRDDLDEMARRRQYRDFGHLLQATAGQSAKSLGAELGLSNRVIEQRRAEYGVKSTLRAAQALKAATDRLARLAAVPPGVQPMVDGVLLCLEPDCGRTFADLAQHLRHGHQLPPEQYRQHHQLADDCALVSAERRQRQIQAATANSSRAASVGAAGKSAAVRRRYDEQARALGDYDGIVGLLTAHPDDRAAGKLLGLTRDQVWRLRRRYVSAVEPGRR